MATGRFRYVLAVPSVQETVHISCGAIATLVTGRIAAITKNKAVFRASLLAVLALPRLFIISEWIQANITNLRLLMLIGLNPNIPVVSQVALLFFAEVKFLSLVPTASATISRSSSSSATCCSRSSFLILNAAVLHE